MTDVIRISQAVQDVDWSAHPKPQCIVTSPPYWGKRVYDVPNTWIGGDPACEHKNTAKTRLSATRKQQVGEDGFQPKRARTNGRYAGGEVCHDCGAWFGQLGQEGTPQFFIEHLADIMNGLPLTDDGVMWINIGDTYLSANAGGLKSGDLAMVPERLAMAMQERGWWLRSMVIWSKLNGMPEAARNRPIGKYEKVLMLTRSKQYFYDCEAVREPIKDSSVNRYKYGMDDRKYKNHALDKTIIKNREMLEAGERPTRPIRNVWEMSTANSRSSHIAPMPKALAERCILLTSRPGDVVMDPFSGSGTTMRVAHELGRVAMGVELDARGGDWTADVGQQGVLV